MATEEQILFSLPLSRMEPIFKQWMLEILRANEGNGSTAPKGEDQFLTIKEAASFLRLAVPTVYAMVSRREIPYMKRRQRLYFSKKSLIEWINGGKRATTDEIKVSAKNSLRNKKFSFPHRQKQ